MGHGTRVRIAKCIYRDDSGIGLIITEQGQQRELRFPFGTTIRTMREEEEKARQQLRDEAETAPAAGTLAADAARYQKQIGQLASAREAWCEVKAWTERLGPRLRSEIAAEDVRLAIVAWSAEGKSPKTITNRINRLARLYRVLDGRAARTPCDDVERLKPTRRPIVRITAAQLRAVAAALEARERRGLLRSSRTRARFLVLATTGRRPCEVMRAKATDVDLEARVWVPRDAKGGFTPGIYLNDDMRAAWRLFAKSKAWGRYETSAFAVTLRSAGWPAGVPPYMLRHTVGIALSEAGVDLADVQAQLGHRHITTTRRHYVPVLHSRLEAASRVLDGRFACTENLEPQATSGALTTSKA